MPPNQQPLDHESDDLVALYAQRLGLSLPTGPSLENLAILQQAHMRTIPFENIDVFLGLGVSLDSDRLAEKILVRRRGGYCFELNLLYAQLLEALGYDISLHLGRVWLRNPSTVPMRNHACLTVEIDRNRFLTDVGFGARAPRQPLSLMSDEPVDDGDGLIRLTDRNGEKLVQRMIEGQWADQYSFETVPAYRSDIEAANFYMSQSPSSHFRNDLFVGLFTEKGRLGMWNDQFTESEGDERSSSRVHGFREWTDLLLDPFGIELDVHAAQARRIAKALGNSIGEK